MIIKGNGVGTPMPRSDWNQTDPNKADYIKNKPDVATAEDLRSHVADKANPHAVTAAQVGARPDTWFPTPAEIGARDENWLPTAAEVGARADDWLPTIAEIGAAPSGYGLGGSGAWVDALNNATKSGFYCWTSSAQNTPFGYGNLLVLVRSDRITQIGIDPYMTGHGGIVIRHYTGSNWLPWEWVNPPMQPGVEYRTTERYDGKVVYRKALDLGALPNTSSKNVAHNKGTSGVIVSIDAYAISSSATRQAFPFITSSGSIAGRFHATDYNVVLTTFSDVSGYNGYAILRYTKD